jgi:hypothetical protein
MTGIHRHERKCLKKVRQAEKRLTHRKIETLKSESDSSGRQQAFPLVTLQLPMRKYPLGVCSSATLPFLCTQPAQAAILADGELRLADRPAEFVRRVPVAHLLARDQHNQHGFDILKPFFERHAAPFFSMPLSLAILTRLTAWPSYLVPWSPEDCCGELSPPDAAMATEIAAPSSTPTGPNRIKPAMEGPQMTALTAKSVATASRKVLAAIGLSSFLVKSRGAISARGSYFRKRVSREMALAAASFFAVSLTSGLEFPNFFAIWITTAMIIIIKSVPFPNWSPSQLASNMLTLLS